MAGHVMIPASTFREAVNGMVAKPEEKQTLLSRIPADNSAVKVYLTEAETALLKELNNLRLASTTRVKITTFLSPVVLPEIKGMTAEAFDRALESKPTNFSAALALFQQFEGQAFEIQVMGRWYPFRMPKVDLLKSSKRIVGFYFNIKFQMVRSVLRLSRGVFKENFTELHGEHSLREILQSLHVRTPEQAIDPEHTMSRLIPLSISMAEDFGKQVLVRGPILEVKTDNNNQFYGGDLSWETHKNIFEKEKAVVEPELETPGRRRSPWQDLQTSQEDFDGVLPFIRVFSLRTRTYMFTDIRNVESYVYNTGIEDRLKLDPNHRRIIRTIFEADGETVKDLVAGKTGGLCVLAYGNPGVGKTLTAEVYAELKERPYYPLSVSEIGTSPKEIETNLQRVFSRVERWQAVLGFDECDVFIAKRGKDIKQAAIVGMFLRLIEYYTGTLFLTTNRVVEIDDAIDSRLAFRIHYPDLDVTKRRAIWEELLKEAKLTVSEEVLNNLVARELDGRKIRHLVRALQMMKLKEVSQADINFLEPFILMRGEK